MNDDVLDCEIVLVRVIDAPRQRVFRASTDPEQLVRWFGPRGFTTRTHELDLREGGRWRLDMLGPNGVVFPNRMVFVQIRSPDRLVTEHGADTDDPDRFHVTVTLDEQSNGKTVPTLRQLHPRPALRVAKIAFGAVEIGQGTLSNLQALLASTE